MGGRTQEASVRLEAVGHPAVSSQSSTHSGSTEERGTVKQTKLDKSNSDSTVSSDSAKTRSYSWGSKNSSSGKQKVKSRSSSSSEAPVIVVSESQELVKDEAVASEAQKSQSPHESAEERMSSESPSHDTGERKADDDAAVTGREEELGETGGQPMDKKEEGEGEESRGKGKHKSIKVKFIFVVGNFHFNGVYVMCVQVPRRRRSIEEDISKTKKRLQEVRKPTLVFLIHSTLQSLKLQITCSWDMLCTQRRRMLLNR